MSAPSTPRPRTAAELLEFVDRSQLLAGSLLQRLRRFYDSSKLGSAREFSQRLIQDQVLTHFQAGRLLKGEFRFYFRGLKLLELRTTCNESVGHVAEEVQQQRLVQLDLWPIDQSVAGETTVSLEQVALARTEYHRFLVPCRSVELIAGEESHVCLVTDFEEQPSLASRVQKRGPLSPLEAASVVSQLAEAVKDLSLPPLSRPVTLDELTLSEGNLRWNKGWGDVRHVLKCRESGLRRSWPAICLELYFQLLGKKAALSEADRPLSLRELPGSIRIAFEQALKTDELQPLITTLPSIGILPAARCEDVPASLRRRALTVHLRRSPDWRTAEFPELDIHQLTAPVKPKATDRKPVPDLNKPSLSTPHQAFQPRLKRRQLGSLIPALILLVGLIMGEFVVWWYQSQRVSAQEDSPAVDQVKPIPEPREAHNPLDANALTP